ncbi:hypothetical protein HKX48_001014 [Thoreauomyces humboldtii]|nr:hypothetical protein HKX48_001014 [Thoreauomyces humboldtii]
MFLNAFRTSALLFLGIAAWFYLNADKNISRQKRAPIFERTSDVDAITAPLLGASIPRGTSYTIKYTTTVPMVYVNVDFYTVAGTTTFLVEGPNNQTDSGSITLDLPKTFQTGANFVIKVWGPVAAGGFHYIPDSALFSIVDPSAGYFISPLAPSVSAQSMVAGRQQDITFSLGSAFSSASTVRIDILNSLWPDAYNVADGYSIGSLPAPCNVTYLWEVPASFRTNVDYHLRVTISDPNNPLKPGTMNAAIDTDAVLHSALFSITSTTAMENTAMTFTGTGTAASPIVWNNGQIVSIGWLFNPDGLTSTTTPVSTWTVELYNTVMGYPESVGVNIGRGVVNTNTGATISYTVPSTLAAGIYFVRAWGYSGPATINTIDPISGISAVITVVNSQFAAANALTVSIPSVWPLATTQKVTWVYNGQQTDYWNIDLYRNSVIYKQFKSIAVHLPNSTYSWSSLTDNLLDEPANQQGNDYSLHVFGNVGTTQVGALSSTFAITPAAAGSSTSGSTSSGSGSGSSGSSSINATTSSSLGSTSKSSAAVVGKSMGTALWIASVVVVLGQLVVQMI